MKLVFLSLLLIAFTAPNEALSESLTSKRTFQRYANNYSNLSNKRKWQVARAGLLHGRTKWSIGKLKGLINKRSVPQDELRLTLGRAHYQRGHFISSAKQYKLVPKSSQFWVKAQEELAWSYLNSRNENKVREVLVNLLNPAYEDKVSPETYYLATLSGLRICDYPYIVNTVDRFKKRFTVIAPELEAKNTRESKNTLDEISRTIKRLQLVEAELIQRVHVAERPKGKTKIDTEGSGDVLIFPKDSDELWRDEIDHFRAAVNKCPDSTEKVL